jgi:hypothetical protein
MGHLVSRFIALPNFPGFIVINGGAMSEMEIALSFKIFYNTDRLIFKPGGFHGRRK